MKKSLFLAAILLVAGTLAAQTFPRRVIIEQFTTAQCGYCPAGMDRISAATEGTSGLIWIKYHSGFGTDQLTNPVAEYMIRYFGDENTFAPAMMIDRKRLDNSRPGPVMSVGQTLDIRRTISQRRQVKSSCKFDQPDIIYDVASRRLHGTISGRFDSGANIDSARLVVYLIEDSISMQQRDYYNGNSATGYYINYWHFGTVREAITDMVGETVQVDQSADMTFSYALNYVMPQDCNYANCQIVAVVYNYDEDDVNNCEVLNAIQSQYLDNNVGISDVSNSCSLHLFPNPAQHHVIIEADTPVSRVAVLDAMGRQLISLDTDGQQQADLDISSLSTGVYIVCVLTAQGYATRQLVIK